LISFELTEHVCARHPLGTACQDGAVLNATHSSSTDGLTESELSAFFVDWPRPPSNEQRATSSEQRRSAA